MKKIIKLALAIASASALAVGCSNVFEEETDIVLTRCLQPTELSAKVVASKGNDVIFSWNVGKDADKYTLELYSDKDLSELYSTTELSPEQVPFTMTVEADATYYYRVQASSQTRGESNWAIYTDDSNNPKAIKTFAVKDNLYLKITDRASQSLSLSWSKEVADYKEVTEIVYGQSGAAEDELHHYTLTEEDIENASATITDLTPSTEYVVSLYYLSANRGELVAWTLPSKDGLTEVSTSAALEQAIKDGANISLSMDGSPYTVSASALEAGVATSKGFKIYGVGAADGSRPEIIGTISILSDFNGGDILLEGVKFNGSDGTCGFAIQRNNDAGIADPIAVNSIVYKNCEITGYSKGIFYEWGKTLDIGEFLYENTIIHDVNADGSGGGDGFDLRNATVIDKLSFTNCTIYNGFRTFLRIDSPATIGELEFNNNTVMNLCFVDNTNNGGIFGLQSKPSSFSIKSNLFLGLVEKATLTAANTKYIPATDLGVSAKDNYFYGCAETISTDNMSIANLSGTVLSADPCYNAKAGIFNINPDSDIAGAQIGASAWWSAYVEEPEDLTLALIEGAHTWDFSDAKFFSGTAKKHKVRDYLYIAASENNPIALDGGKVAFTAASVCTRKGLPTEGYLCFKVNKPGSVLVRPVEGGTSHIIVATAVEGAASVTVKGGASEMSEMANPQKILISDITEETLVYVYASGAIAIDQLAWSNDVSQVNTALPAPEPVVEPSSVVAGEQSDLLVKWEPVENAGSYSVVFSGKTYAVEELEYTISGSVVKMLDAGSYTVNVYANPAASDIYNTQSAAGTAAFAVVPAGGSEDAGNEFVVASVDDLLTAIAAGKDAITLKYSDTPYEIGALTLTAPLHLSGQTQGDKKTPIIASFILSGEIGGSVVLKNLDITNEGVSVLIEDKTAPETAPHADTVAVLGCHIHDTKALYDNSGKTLSCIQVLQFKDNVVENCSNGADFIDLRTGSHHTVSIVNNTFANSCRTFIRTDAVHELNYLTVRNNTFYKVATNSSSKDNNGIFHVRSAGGAGLLEYKVLNNIFYSILIDADPSNANGFPKFRSKSGVDPITVVNNYFYNCEDREDKAAYSFWSFYSKEAAIAGGGAILPSDPFKDAENGDYTLVNGVAMNANVGDPRWNPSRGSVPSSEITVNNVDELLTAISAGKTTITLADGEYDFTAVLENPDITSGKLTISKSLNLTGSKAAVLKGGFQFNVGVEKFSVSGITLDGAATVDNAFYVMEGAQLESISFNDVVLKNYKNRFLYQDKETSSTASVVISKLTAFDMGTSGDFIDFRKGTLSALKIQNSTFYNGIRTVMRIDAAVNCNSILVRNNTFFNLCSVDSKDNNGIFHIRSTSATSNTENIQVKNNIFAGMHRAAETPGQANGFPKLVSSASSAIANPSFSHNYYYDVDGTEAGAYSWWNKTDSTLCVAGNGVVLKESPFRNAADGDFTLMSALAASENVGDSRWNTIRPDYSGESFPVANVDEMLMAIAAGKKDLTLTGSEYDLFAIEGNEPSGVLAITEDLTLNGKLIHGLKPVIKGGFTLATVGGSFILNNLVLDGNYQGAEVNNADCVGNMIEVLADASISNIVIRDCEVKAYKNRMVSGPAVSTVGSLLVTRNDVHDMGTGGDFIDFRKGTVNAIKVLSNSFYNGIRTFLRVDAAVVCTSIAVKNNTFYNLGSVDSKDNNGIMHVRSTTATADPRQIVVEKNIFAGMHREAETPSNAAAGFPHLLSKTSSAIAVPTFIDNIFFDIETVAPYSWWQYPDGFDPAKAGTVLDATPFAGDPATGKFTVVAAYKGYGDLRW